MTNQRNLKKHPNKKLKNKKKPPQQLVQSSKRLWKSVGGGNEQAVLLMGKAPRLRQTIREKTLSLCPGGMIRELNPLEVLQSS